MKALPKKLAFPGFFLTAALATSMGSTKPNIPPPDKSEVERGRYLVEEVAKCPECHTPRNTRGELDHQAWLQGATIGILPVQPIPNWAPRAPALAAFRVL
jgi:hypothetical protein